MGFDASGKQTFDDIYTQPDPRAYFSALRGLEYQIPGRAKPYFAALIEEYRDELGVAVPLVLDIGSSYGNNAALLRCDLEVADLFDRYRDTDQRDRAALVAEDRELVRTRRGAAARFTGLDISEPALAYALEAGFLDHAVAADLEHGQPTAEQARVLAGTDLVISTGSLGYVGVNTLTRVVQGSDRLPWMAHFVLRMFPFDPIEERLSGLGYDTVRLPGVHKQRRFSSAEEHSRVLDTLAEVGVDPAGLESDGWLYAQLHISGPRDSAAPRFLETFRRANLR
ncbi:carnitine O-acetyltransferase [Crossiella equi]|uniref:Carnitine O-acetyltransferase n=1 Tax=Crossiella equi TaxID=130796 RepID=A0ABS5ASI9_9PSEU|nr:class I SAM-dependent methyltransferase [Crossiella equi]MBP2479391.1 carnitine O-acetyltransferase [Crossiella equi]